MENVNENTNVLSKENVEIREKIIEKHIPVDRIVKEEVIIEKDPVLISFKRSDDIIELATSLVAFHSELEAVDKSSINPFFKNKYASLSSILSHIRPILAKNGLSVMQFPIDAGQNRVSIKTILLHKSGQFMESDCVPIKPPKNSSQDFGAVQTYSRRYSLQAILSVSFEEDDDGNVASGKVVTQQPVSQPKPQTQTPQPATSGRIGRI